MINNNLIKFFMNNFTAFFFNNFQWIIPLAVGGIIIPLIICWILIRNQNEQKNKINDFQFENQTGNQFDENFSNKKNKKSNYLIDGQFLANEEWFLNDENGDNEKELNIDIDGDGNKETILFGRHTPNGTKLLVIIGKDNFELGSQIKGLEEFDELPGGGCQLVLVDVTNDGFPEILLGFRSNFMEVHLNIWRFDKKKYLDTPRGTYLNPFIFIDDIVGQGFENYRILPGGKIEVPYGSQGFYDTYIWNGEKFVSEY